MSSWPAVFVATGTEIAVCILREAGSCLRRLDQPLESHLVVVGFVTFGFRQFEIGFKSFGQEPGVFSEFRDQSGSDI